MDIFFIICYAIIINYHNNYDAKYIQRDIFPHDIQNENGI